MRYLNLLNEKYGRLLVIDISLERLDGRSKAWMCKCDCGNIVLASAHNLRRGKTTSCGCFNREQSLKANTIPNGGAAFNRIVAQYKRDAKDRNLSWELTKEDCNFIFKQNCHYCGSVPFRSKKAAKSVYIFNGIDRVNNAKGYILKNVVPCCTICNRAKRELSEKEFMSLNG